MKKLLNTLYINTPDRYLSLDGETVVVSANNKEIGRVPLHNLERIMSFGYAGASPALMGKCVSSGIELVFMSRNGRFLARAEGEVSGNVLLRREQYRIADDPERSLGIARNIIAAKLFNTRWSVERTIREYSMRVDADKLKKCSLYLKDSTKNALNACNMDTLRGIEGEGAQIYFGIFDELILSQKDKFSFTVRSKRPPMDRINALLSFAYSLATGMCSSALEAVGLDPYVGFMHTDRPGRRSLALDLVEEFRAPLCDRFVLALVNKKQINEKDFEYREDGAVFLSESGRKNFIAAWQKRKDEELKHPFINEKIQWGMLARYIRGDLDEYPPFMWK